MKKYSFPIWVFALAPVLVSFLVVLAFRYHDNQAIKNFSITTQCDFDSLKNENAALRQALAAKMESHCDTMTVDQKLAQQKLDDYTYKMYKIKEAQEFKAYKAKENAEFKAYRVQEDADLKCFMVYQKKEGLATIEFEKTDSKNFIKYAVFAFKESACCDFSYEETKRSLDEKEKLVENASVKRYLDTKSSAWAVRESGGKKLEAEYKKKISEIGLKYQNQLKAINENYNSKIAAKKIELGL